MHPDAGTFLIFACGDWLLADDGYCAKFTCQQNTLTVNGIGQTGEGGDWFEGVLLRREHRWPWIFRADSTPAIDYVVGNAAPAYEARAGLRRFLRHLLFVKPATWIVIDEIEAEQPAAFEVFFHAYHPFTPGAGNRHVVAAPNGSLLIHPLLPADGVAKAFRQTIRAGTIPNKDRPMDALVLSNRTPSREAIFITVLHAYRTASTPKVSAGLTGPADAPCVILDGPGASREFPLCLHRSDLAAPIVSNLGF